MTKHGWKFINPLTLLFLITFQALGAEYPATDRWQYTIGGFLLEDKINPKPHAAIVATGSSSILFWEHRIHDDLKPLRIIPRGFGGSNMNDVLTYLDALVLKHDPRAVLIYEGGNDVAQGVPVATIIDTFRATFTRLHDHNADMRIYLMSVKPSLPRAELWNTMREINAQLKAIAASDQRIFYIDVATPMLNQDGTTKAELFIDDGLHMNQDGYDIWRDTVAPYLLEREARYEFTQ